MRLPCQHWLSSINCLWWMCTKSIMPSIIISRTIFDECDFWSNQYPIIFLSCKFAFLIVTSNSSKCVNFRTIVYISMIYILGHLLKTLAAVPNIGVPPVWVDNFSRAQYFVASIQMENRGSLCDQQILTKQQQTSWK